MMNTRVFSGDIGCISQLSMRRPEKLFKLHPRLLYCRHEIPLVNCQPELACTVEYDVGDVGRLDMGVRCPRDIG